MPCAAHEGRVLTEDLDTEGGEFQPAHLMAGTGIRGFVAVERRLPAAGLLGSGEESQVGRVPVTGHEGVEVVMVPGLLLGAEDVLDGGGVVACGGVVLGGLRGREGGYQEEGERQTAESIVRHESSRKLYANRI